MNTGYLAVLPQENTSSTTNNNGQESTAHPLADIPLINVWVLVAACVAWH